VPDRQALSADRPGPVAPQRIRTEMRISFFEEARAAERDQEGESKVLETRLAVFSR